MNNILKNAEGLSLEIQSIQETLYSELQKTWAIAGGRMEGFGKVYKNIQNSSDNIPKYYKSSKIFVPEVYNSSKANYEDVFYSKNNSCVFCFLTGDNDSTKDGLVYTSKVKIVFMVDLSIIYTNLQERQDSRVQEDVVEILRNFIGSYRITGIQKGIDNVFNEYTTTGIKFDDLQPLHVFSVNIDLDYYLTDRCT